MQKKKEKKNTGLFIYENFSKDTMELRKSLWKQVLKYRKQKKIRMPKLQEHHSKRLQWCKINIDLFYFLRVTLSQKIEGITKESVNKEQQAQNFENLKYDPLENSGNILFDNSSDPDLHFYNTNIQNLNTPYILPEELQKFLGDDKDENVSVLHLNIRSINKNFENFKMFLSNLNLSFSIICFSETWLNDSNVDNSNYELPNYVSVHQIRNHYKGGGVSVYIHKNF